MGMMGKLKDAQKSAEETKLKLNSVLVSDDAAGGAIRITATANKEIKEIEIVKIRSNFFIFILLLR